LAKRWAAFLTGEATQAWTHWCGLSEQQRSEFFDRRAVAVEAMRAAAAVEMAV
jgi:hypothetical protein